MKLGQPRIQIQEIVGTMLNHLRGGGAMSGHPTIRPAASTNTITNKHGVPALGVLIILSQGVPGPWVTFIVKPGRNA